MPGQKSFIEKKHPGFYMNKYGSLMFYTLLIAIEVKFCLYNLQVTSTFTCGKEFYYFNSYFTTMMQGCKHLAQIATTLSQPCKVAARLLQTIYSYFHMGWLLAELQEQDAILLTFCRGSWDSQPPPLWKKQQNINKVKASFSIRWKHAVLMQQ